jgi:hypothetical protein
MDLTYAAGHPLYGRTLKSNESTHDVNRWTFVPPGATWFEYVNAVYPSTHGTRFIDINQDSIRDSVRLMALVRFMALVLLMDLVRLISLVLFIAPM